MLLTDVVDYWSGQYRNSRGEWMHPDDERAFAAGKHSFNLDHPVSPFVGNILEAPIIIMGANAGYRAELTPTEFPDSSAVDAYLARVRDPAAADWSFVSKYYDNVNYGDMIVEGRAALVNACAYRSPRISEERDNKKLIKTLPSVLFIRRWLLEAVVSLSKAGSRLVIAKRPGLWNLPPSTRQCGHVVFDPAPVSAQLAHSTLDTIRRWESDHR